MGVRLMRMKAKSLLVAFLVFSLLSCGESVESSSWSRPPLDESALVRDESGFAYSYHDKEKGFFIEDYQGDAESIVIPDELTDNGRTEKVVGIDDFAFSLRKGLKTLVLGENVRSIGHMAFAESEIENLYITESLIITEKDTFKESNIRFNEVDGYYYLPSKDNPCLAVYRSSATGPALLDSRCKTILPNAGISLPEDGRETINAIGDGNRSSTISGTEGFHKITQNPYKIRHAGDYAFKRSTGLTSVELLEGAPYIGTGAFFGCEDLTSITIPDTVTEIREDAFYGTKLASIDLPSSLLSLGSHALRGCSKLQDVTIPRSVTKIGEGAFEKCSSDLILYFEADYLPTGFDPGEMRVYVGFRERVTIDGVTYAICEENREKIASVDAVDKTLEEVNILEEVKGMPVTRIRRKAFSGCSELKSVHLPSTLRQIDKNAFPGGHSKLSSLVIPNGVTLIEKGALAGCTKYLKTITLPFIGTTPNAENGILGHAFGYENNVSLAIETVVLTEICEGIPAKAFASCSKLMEVRFSETITSIGEEAFASCPFTSFTVPTTVTSIGKGIFSGCNHIQDLTLPYVGSSAQDTTGSLAYFFGGSSSEDNSKVVPTDLKKITINGDGVSIPQNAFQNCSRLEEAEIDGGVKSVGDYAFAGCISLSEVRVLSPKMVGFGNYAFQSCPSPKVYVARKDANWTSSDALFFNGFDTTKEVDGVTYALVSDEKGNKRAHVVWAEKSVSDVVLPSEVDGYSVCAIRKGAFKGTSLRSISFPSSLYSIEENAFDGCYFYELSIPSTIAYVARGALANTKIQLLRLSKLYGPNNGDAYLGYLFGADEAKNNKNYVPSNLLKVTLTGGGKIPTNAFYGCSSLLALEIVSSVSSIGDEAFYGCSNLERLVIPVTSSRIKPLFYTSGKIPASLKTVEIVGANSIPEDYFKNYDTIEHIVLPGSVSSIGNSAFYGCAALQDINLPTSLTSLGSSAFYGCSSLTSIDIPSGIRTIPAHAFTGCSSLASVKMGDQVTEIGNYSFSGCSSLPSISLPSGLVSIGEYAFTECSKFTGITLPSSLETLGAGAFSDCDSLTSLSIPSKVTSIGDYCLNDCYALAELSIPLLEGRRLTEIYNFTYDVHEERSPSLKTLTICNGTAKVIPQYYAYDLNTIETINIGPGITGISAYAFESCYSTTAVNHYSDLTDIDSNAFRYCYNVQFHVVS